MYSNIKLTITTVSMTNLSNHKNIPKTSWWLNQPLSKIWTSKWVHLPQFSGWKFQKSLSCHHPVKPLDLLGHRWEAPLTQIRSGPDHQHLPGRGYSRVSSSNPRFLQMWGCVNFCWLTSKNFPTDPWSIPQTPNQQFMKEFLSFGGLGMSGVCCRGMLGFP